ncbi:hypothetical protein K431DRAFT_262474 [Polychaeton citri CBS 116435]|uniref:F-BAR domain-containing protein n=1 Tax=Polychaeton citri CBS 116435 TaxID=1314669 RepID=A0A9P4QC78_9PEZI|nr:hypothetical protein K431DRAFT_262474 [Polychaeton citri CBS 116435]
MPGTAADGPTVSLSFANNFWGKDDAGVGPLLERMHNAKVTGDELKSFYTARAQIEEDYAKKLMGLSKKPLGSAESGTLKLSLDVLRAEVESMAKQHQHNAQQMRSELEEPLASFHGGIKERRKIVQTTIEKLLKTKLQQANTVNKTRDRFEQDCLKIKGYLAQGHMVMGQEERKNKAKLEKTQVQMSQSSGEYEAAVKVLEETTGRWNREWKAACDKFQDLEEERIDFFKSSLWSFANIASTVCVSDDASCEKVRLSLEDCDVEKDITSFIKDSGTGQEIPDPPKYINFCRGDIDDASSSDGSDDGNYAVAQFQRTMNPTYRTSSPQPSTFESHNDPDSSLREEMGLPKARTSLQSDDAFVNLRSSQNSAQVPPSFRSSQGSGYNVPAPLATQASQNPIPPALKASDPYAEVPQIPHNPYPADGMTQFCRPDMRPPPSDRSANPSPIRPSSRDSHSDQYSNPSSFTSIEPDAALPSPIKDYNGSNLSGMSGVSGYTTVSSEPETNAHTVHKKKSGFFNSPFRRRSHKRKEESAQAPAPAPITTHIPAHIPAPAPAPPSPTTRNIWAPANTTRQSASVTTSAGSTPTKPLWQTGRANTWAQKQPSPSPEPDGDNPNSPGYQLGIGNNVFNVASPDKRTKPKVPAKDAPKELDPIAQALAELKGINKHASVRQSADRHYGMATPAPGSTSGGSSEFEPRAALAGAVPTPFANPMVRSTPPPAYDQPPVSRLGAPQPAHTSREMKKTTERFTAQKRDMFSTASSRPQHVRSGSAQEPPRAASPQPPRAASPRPYINERQQAQPAPLRATSPRPNTKEAPRPAPQQQAFRAASPNPYTASNSRPRAQSTSPIKPQPNYSGYSSRGNSPGYQPAPRATSPNPAYSHPPPSVANAASRPPSSRGSDHGGVGGANAMVLAPAPSTSQQDPYGGSQRGGRSQAQHYGGEHGYDNQQMAVRTRSQSMGAQRQYTKDGRPILHYARAMYMYQAAIPEELSFAKSDILAVLRQQDDGWWEAEVVGKNSRPGLVPSNYLKNC